MPANLICFGKKGIMRFLARWKTCWSKWHVWQFKKISRFSKIHIAKKNDRNFRDNLCSECLELQVLETFSVVNRRWWFIFIFLLWKKNQGISPHKRKDIALAVDKSAFYLDHLSSWTTLSSYTARIPGKIYHVAEK